ncbi:class I SAM-dependent methyltransferase [Mycobacterium sp. E2497]|uniref:class I SAM-dependent methyltransferase n=1 Tax=Mycobacterium sp. E2497 TaxID=1834135 RepID=UPI000802004C|nr:class I SAM-dependent methyltransferase [Mycobacterium sp. E2497]OBI16251.1 methyltransferase [Mycobacterium sp. E2497]
MTMQIPALTPAQESLFLTLGGRALDSRLPQPFLGDTMADEVLTEVGYDLARFPVLTAKFLDPRSRVFDIAVRAKVLDDLVRRFTLDNPDAVVLDLGAGLDSRIFRVGPPPGVSWYDIDFPEVIALRSRVVPQHAQAHSVGADLTDPGWLNDIPGSRPAVIVADGLVAFLTEDGFVSLLDRLVQHFPGGQLAFNLYTRNAIWAVKHAPGMAVIADGVVNPGFNDPRQPERWVGGIKLVDEIFLTRAPEITQLPPMLRATARLAAPSARISRLVGTVVVVYRF